MDKEKEIEKLYLQLSQMKEKSSGQNLYPKIDIEDYVNELKKQILELEKEKS